MDYLTKKTDNMRTKDRHKMTSYFFPVPKYLEFGKFRWELVFQAFLTKPLPLAEGVF